MRTNADTTLPESPAQAESLSRRELGEKLMGAEGVKGAQGRLRKHFDALNQSITDPEKGIHENSEALQGAARELWLLKRVGKPVSTKSEKHDNQLLLKEVNRHAEVMAGTLDTGRIGDEDALALGRLSYAGVLSPEVQKKVQKGLENTLTNKTALGRYEGDVSVLLMTARQIGLFDKGSDFIQNKGTWPEVRSRLQTELAQVGVPWPGEKDEVRAAARLALRRTRLKLVGMEEIVPEAEAALPNEKLEEACHKAAETRQVGPLARLRRSQAYLLPPEQVLEMPEAEKKLFLNYAGELQRQHSRSGRFLRFAGDVLSIFKKESLTVAEVAAMDDLEERPKKEKQQSVSEAAEHDTDGGPETYGVSLRQPDDSGLSLEAQEKVENREGKQEKKVEKQKEEEEDTVFKKLFGPGAAAQSVESAGESGEEEEEGTWETMVKVMKAIWKFIKWVFRLGIYNRYKQVKSWFGGGSAEASLEPTQEEGVAAQESEEIIEERPVVESSSQSASTTQLPASTVVTQADTSHQEVVGDDRFQTQEYMVAPRVSGPVKVQVGEGDLDQKAPVKPDAKPPKAAEEDEPWRTKTYLVGAGLDEEASSGDENQGGDVGPDPKAAA